VLNVGAGAGSYEPADRDVTAVEPSASMRAQLPAGLAVAVAILTCDPGRLRRFWLTGYAPEVIDTEASRYPAVEALSDGLGAPVASTVVPVPLDCTDGFNEAYYGRPEALLDPAARLSCSAWSFVGAAVHDRFTRDLSRDLADGTWDDRHGHLRSLPAFDGSLILAVSQP
jgi:hypothetical protein